MKSFFLFLVVIYGLLNSCIILKDDRIVKKKTKEWRDSPVVLSSYGDTPFYGIFLTLRENGKFEYESSGMLKTFSSGTWTRNNDTIQLVFVDSELNSGTTDELLLNRTNNSIHFISDTNSFIRMRLMVNKL